MTIFGFNTNVQHGDVVYHVESQARQGDLLLQTMIFVKGSCVGKHAYSYAGLLANENFSEAAMHELLKAQHKAIVDAFQHGTAESVLRMGSEIEDVGGSGLVLRWSNPSEPSQQGSIAMRFQVLDSGKAVPGAEVAVWACPPADAEVLARALTDSNGHAALAVPVAGALESGVMAQAKYGSKSATRKFRFRK
jgi:hypothetical protein